MLSSQQLGIRETRVCCKPAVYKNQKNNLAVLCCIALGLYDLRACWKKWKSFDTCFLEFSLNLYFFIPSKKKKLLPNVNWGTYNNCIWHIPQKLPLIAAYCNLLEKRNLIILYFNMFIKVPLFTENKLYAHYRRIYVIKMVHCA